MTVEANVMAADEGARPTATLPNGQLVRLSLYWLGLSSVFTALAIILGGRILFEGLGDEAMKATTLFILSFMGTIIAVLVQPTVGSISDYTISRWGRRKPYIFIGSTLDIVFLLGIASSNTVIAIAAFMALLQFSANFAQGPFQGYIPDLVPDKQVGLASALVGLFQVLGTAAGFAIGAIAVATNNFWLGTMALGLLEFVTMLAVVIRVSEGRTPKAREGRSWRSIAAEAWGTDILRERSFVWLVWSRWFVLMGMTMLTNFALFYFVQSFGIKQVDTGGPMLAVLAATVLGNAAGFAIGAIAVATNSFWLGTMALGALEFVTMLAVVIRVNEGRTPKSRAGRSWRSIGAEAWGTDILKERSFVWLVWSRWFVLMGMNMLINFAIFYFAQSFKMKQEDTGGPMLAVLAATVVGTVIAVVPAARVSDRVGRKPVIYAACAVGAVGLGIVAVSPALPVTVFGGLIMGAGFGMFMAVDWALLTDLVPKASAGRYMGISNVATATAGLVGLAIGAVVIDVTNAVIGEGVGPRIAIGLSVPLLAIGALLLRPVEEPQRGGEALEPVPA